MSATSTIEWTSATWNPVAGCSVVSPGCKHCYAMKMAARIEAMQAALGKPTHYAGLTQPGKAGAVCTGRMAVAPDKVLTKPLRWKKPRRIFVNSMSDLFHEDVADETIDRVFAVMALCPQHTFQILTKRAKRMREYMLAWPFGAGRFHHVAHEAYKIDPTLPHGRDGWTWQLQARWPLPNVWLGVSTEDQERADERIPELLATPADRRFISAEPLLGPVDVLPYLFIYTHADNARLADETDDVIARPLDFNDPATTPPEDICTPRLDWVIAGGESGPGARPMHPDWVRSLRDQCATAEVPFFFKQWGEWLAGENLSLKAGSFARWQDGEVGRHSTCREGQGPEWRHFGVVGQPGAFTLRVGKKAAGAVLDGKLHREFPK